jgi:hypothetical protein
LQKSNDRRAWKEQGANEKKGKKKRLMKNKSLANSNNHRLVTRAVALCRPEATRKLNKKKCRNKTLPQKIAV